MFKEWIKADDQNLKSLHMIHGENWDKISASVSHAEEEIEPRCAYINSDNYVEPTEAVEDEKAEEPMRPLEPRGVRTHCICLCRLQFLRQ